MFFASEDKYPGAIWTADYIILGHKQINTLSGDAHKAAITAIGPFFTALLFNHCNSLAIIGFGNAFEYLQRFVGYALCNLVPFSLDFVYLGLVFACQRLDFGSELLEMLYLLIYLALYFFAFGFIDLNIFQQLQRL
jgi:hypothetical protein